MDCEQCGTASRPTANFCRACGHPLAPRSPNGGATVEIDARFCDSCGKELSSRPSLLARRVRENAATAAGMRVTAAVEHRDFDALADVFADGYVENIQDPARSAMHRNEVLEGLRTLFGLADVSLEIEPIATLDESLQLHRTHISGNFGDQGPSAIDYISVIEVDSEGRLLRTDAFDVDRLGEAFIRMFERYEELLSDGRVRGG